MNRKIAVITNTLHCPLSGGIWNAFGNAEECNSKSFAIFLRNQRQWNAKALDEETIEKWKEAGEVRCIVPSASFKFLKHLPFHYLFLLRHDFSKGDLLRRKNLLTSYSTDKFVL